MVAALACVSAATAGAAPAYAPVKVLIGIGLSKPPYFMSPSGTGIEYDIADKALEAGGYKMVVQQFPPSRALALMRAGKLDGMLSVTEGIGGSDFFSDTYVHYQNVAITLASRRIRLRNIDDLSGYSVAAFQNASLVLGDEFKALAARHPDYREHPQQLTQNKLLYTGRVDVVVGDRLIFRYLTQQLEAPIDTSQELSFHPLFPLSPRKAVFHDVAVRDGFNAGLRTIRQNGTYAAILKKYQDYLQP